MSTVVPSSAPHAPAARSATPPVSLRRAPVLLSLPALQAPSSAPAPREEPPRLAPEPPSDLVPETPLVEETEQEERSHGRREHRHDEGHARKSHRERHARRHPRSEVAKKPALSQWVLGGCMLGAGVIGFFVLSGDFGGSTGDAPTSDHWSQSGEDLRPPTAEFGEPQFSPATPITVHREPTPAPQGERNWSNPAEGEIAVSPPAPTGPAMPNWMNANAMAGSAAGPRHSVETATQAATDGAPAQPAAHQTGELHLAPPQTGTPTPAPTYNYPTTSAAAPTNAYPNTSAAGLGTPASPLAQSGQSAYPSTGYELGTGAFGASNSNAPAARTGMLDAGVRPGYPDTGAGSPNALQSPFPNNAPPAMSPRYERIR